MPLNQDDMPYINPQSLHSDGSVYNPEDPFNPTLGHEGMQTLENGHI